MRAGWLVAAAALAMAAEGQTRGFDVASIHPSALSRAGAEGSKRSSIRHTPKTLTMENVSLTECLTWAYGVSEPQISGPDWMGSERFDIAAGSAEPDSLAGLRQKLQTLLADRFRLELHRESKDYPVYALVKAPAGPNLQRAQAETGSMMRVSGGAFVFEDTSMAELAQKLSQLAAVGRMVVDRTGIAGSFDFRIRMAASEETMRSEAVHGEAPSIFPLIERQLGLKLESRKAPLEMLVVDRVERIPTAN